MILTCVWGQVEVEDGDDGDEDAGNNDIQDIVSWLPLDDQVEGDVLVIVLSYILPGRLVSDMPFATLWRTQVKAKLKINMKHDGGHAHTYH